MSIMLDAVFEGGPRDGETFTHDGATTIQVATVDNDILRFHWYRATNADRTVYRYWDVKAESLQALRNDHRRSVIKWLRLNPQEGSDMDNTAQADRKAADLLLQQQRDAYVQAKVDACLYETGKKPTKKQTDEWAEKATLVIV